MTENLRVLKKLQSYMRDNREIEKFEAEGGEVQCEIKNLSTDHKTS